MRTLTLTERHCTECKLSGEDVDFLLAAHAVAERDFAFENEDAHSVFGQSLRKRRAGEPTTDRDHVVSFCHAGFRNNETALTGYQHTQ